MRRLGSSCLSTRATSLGRIKAMSDPISTDDATDAVDIRQFFLLAMLWLPLGFAAWFYLAGLMSFPVSGLSRWILVGGIPTLFESLTQIDYHFEIKSAIPASSELLQLANRTVGNYAFDVQPMIYGYGLPVMFGLVMSTPMAARRRAIQLLVGFCAVVLVQTWGVCFESLKTAMFSMGPVAGAKIVEAGFNPTVVAFCYQMGYLVLPSLTPVILWVAMNQEFFSVLTLKAGLNQKGAA